MVSQVTGTYAQAVAQCAIHNGVVAKVDHTDNTTVHGISAVIQHYGDSKYVLLIYTAEWLKLYLAGIVVKFSISSVMTWPI